MSQFKEVKIGHRLVGEGHPTYIIAEIGINHNGKIEIAKKLMEIAAAADCDAVKFQKRTVEVVYTSEELAKPRENPFGPTNGDLKHGLEFGYEQYREIDHYANELEIDWFASPWDEGSVDFLEQFDPPCYKVASACLTDAALLRNMRSKGRPVFLSTGMSTLQQIDRAVENLGKQNLVLMHCTSTYPSRPEELNLKVIGELRKRYEVPVGYSGHEVGLLPSVGSVLLGACAVERHITLDRAMWGSDQAASIEPSGLVRLVRDIRQIPETLGDGKKIVYPTEIPILQKLRRVGKEIPVPING